MTLHLLKPIPHFANEDEERVFWDHADTTKHFDISSPIDMDLSQLKPTTESISLRLPISMLGRIKEIANSQDVPYQSLMKTFLARQIDQETRTLRR